MGRGSDGVDLPSGGVLVGAGDLWGPLRAGFASWLGDQGYAESTIRAYLRWLGWFGSWLGDQRMELSAVTDETAEQFGAAMRAAGRSDLMPGCIARMLAYLREAGAVPQADPRSAAAQVPPRDALLAAYRDYLVSRHLAEHTVTVRVRVAALALEAMGEVVSADAVAISPRMVADTLRSWGELARRRSSPLRVFLRFLRMAGLTDQDLAAAIPRCRRCSPARQATRLTGDQAQELVESLDVSGMAGMRDKAVLLLLKRLGLRAVEVSRLDLEDIHWRQGTLRIHRKGGREDELPLPVDVGQALADYLMARPPAATRAVVLTLTAPRQRISGQGVVSIVKRASKQIGAPVGPRQFRYLLGDQMLGAGRNLREIAQVLGHREGSLVVTACYVTPPQQQMAGLVRPWPTAGDAVCDTAAVR